MGNKQLTTIKLESQNVNHNTYNMRYHQHTELLQMEMMKTKSINYDTNVLQSISKLLDIEQHKLFDLLQYKIIFQNNKPLTDWLMELIETELCIKDEIIYDQHDEEKLNEEYINSWITLLKSTKPFSLIMLKSLFKPRFESKIIIKHLIYQHYQNIDALYSTLTALKFLGFTVDDTGDFIILNSDNINTHCIQLNIYLLIQFEGLLAKYDINYDNYQQIRFGMKNIDEFIKEYENKEENVNLLQFDHDRGQESCDLINGFLKYETNNNTMFIPLDVIAICMRYYLIPNWDTNYQYIWCSTNYDGQQIGIHHMETNKDYNIKIAASICDIELKVNIDSKNTFAIKNILFPKWIQNEKLNYYKNMNNKNNLCAIFKAGIVIIFDPINGIGHKIKHCSNKLSRDNILCYNSRNNGLFYQCGGKKDKIVSLNINTNEYMEIYTMYESDEYIKGCLFDRNKKLFICGNHCEVLSLINKNNIKLNNNYLRRMDHNLLYHKALKQIVIAGGLGLLQGSNYYSDLSSNIVEMFDLTKNRWNVIYKKTNNCYKYKPYLWSDDYNPFILNICQNSLGYKITANAEFIDIREQKKWYFNQKINGYLNDNLKHAAIAKIVIF